MEEVLQSRAGGAKRNARFEINVCLKQNEKLRRIAISPTSRGVILCGFFSNPLRRGGNASGIILIPQEFRMVI
jgi:hypothetical protein